MTAAQAVKPPTPPPPQAIPSKPTWTLKDVSSGRRDVAYRLLLAGVEGIGKSTFGAGAPGAIFLCGEDGTNHLDVKRFPPVTSWADAFRAVEVLLTEKHDYRTLVVDTLDWLESLVWEHCCRRDGKRSKAGILDIEAYGYGKGYQAAIDEWRRWMRELERLREKGISVLLLAHTHVKPFKNPLGDDFDRYELKVHGRAAGMWKEWCDAVLFANFEQFAVKEIDDPRVKAKGVASGKRLIYTERTAGYDAKNRYGLPQVLPLSWDEFEQAVRNGKPVPSERLVEQIRAGVPLLAPEDQEKCMAALGRAGLDAQKLSQLLNIVNVKAAEQAGKEG